MSSRKDAKTQRGKEMKKESPSKDHCVSAGETKIEEARPALVPKLRFPEFRGTEGWGIKHLKAAAEINPASDRLPESFIYIDLESVEDGKLKAKNRICRDGAPSRAQRLVESGDIIYQVVRPYQRNNLLCEFDDNEKYVASTGYAQLRVKDSNRFLYQSIHTDSFVGRVIAKCTGSNYPAINSSDLAEIQLPIPPTLPEQQKIAECLSSLDELIAAQARKVDALKTHKKGLMQQLFPREGETQPRLRFPEFREDEGWTSDLMGDVYSFKSNNSLSRDKLNYMTGSVKNIHYGDIHTKFSSHFDITKELVPFINESEEGVVRDEHLCAEGDMIFADASEDMADIGKSIEVVNLNGVLLVSGLHTILARRSGDRIVLGFGGHLFKSGWVRTQIQKEAQGAKVLGISANRMRNIRLPLPNCKAEQQKIAECLSSLDALIATETNKLEALKTHKKGLMQQLFPISEEV